MKITVNSVIDTVVQRLREQAERFNPSLESAPVVVLWTDERREWESVLPNLKSVMPELFSLGAVNPGERTGLGVWLRSSRRIGTCFKRPVDCLWRRCGSSCRWREQRCRWR